MVRNRRAFPPASHVPSSPVKGLPLLRHHGSAMSLTKCFLIPVFFAATLAAADSQVATGMNAFTTATYKQLAPGGANLILSPFNAATALTMALAGARGTTASQMQSVLHIHYDASYPAALDSVFTSVTTAANSGGNQLHSANGLWVQKGFSIVPAFQNTLATHFHAPPSPVDFQSDPDGARAEINRWTEQHTNDKIQNLFPAGSLNIRTRLVLTSAIYFYGKWQDPFSAARTKPAPFTLATGATTEANFMNQTVRTGYAETPDSQLLEMQYAGSGIVFDVLLPKTTGGLSPLESSLTTERLTAWLAGISPREVRISLPRFRAESQFSLSGALSAMGMPAAFTPQADFSGIEPKRSLSISDVVHKAFIDVAEEGTEAAAATGVIMALTSAPQPQPPVVFRADHPFLFLIRDTKSGVILFIGRLTSPR